MAVPLYLYVRYGLPLRPGPRAVASFALGWIALAVALASPLHRAADTSSFLLHVVQQMLLQMVAPPLLLAGVPPAAWDQLGRHPGTAGARRVLLHPLMAAAAYNGVMVAWHWPVAARGGVRLACGVMTELAGRVAGLEVLRDLLPALTGLLFWASVLGRPPLSGAPPAARFAAVGASMVINWLVSFPIIFSDTPMYAGYGAGRPPFGLGPLADQQLGAGIMWEHGNMTYVAAALWLLKRSLSLTAWPRTPSPGGTPAAPAPPPAARSR